MNSILSVCPVIVPPRGGLLRSWDYDEHFVVVNGRHDLWDKLAAGKSWLVARQQGNGGCPHSWNLGFKAAQRLGRSHVLILSQSLLANDGLATAVQCLAEGADDRGAITRHSFHCVVFSVALWEAVGGFDENLPVYCDIDFLRRCYLAGLLSPDRRLPFVNVAADDARNLAMRNGAVPASMYTEDLHRYIAKWGGEPGAEPQNPLPMGGDDGVAL